MKYATLVIAHRGFAGEYFQNSEAALKAAIKLKVDMVEIDIRKTKDNKFVVFRDKQLHRETNSRGSINGKTLKELKKLHLKDGSRILSLKEALSLLKNIRVNLHLKDYFKKENFNFLLKEIKEYRKIITISSFSYPDLKELRHLDRNISIGMNCVLPIKKNINKAAEIKAKSIHPHLSFLMPKFVKMAHENNLKVYAYSQYSIFHMHQLIEANVDGIITDFPDKLQELIKHKGAM